MLYNRALVLCRVEATPRTDEIEADGSYVSETNPGATNLGYALLVEDPQFTPDIQQLERQNVRDTLSQDPIVTGRKIAQLTFRHEVRGRNIVPVSGSPPDLGEALQACAMTQSFRDSRVTVTAPLGDIVDVGSTPASGTFTLTGSQAYVLPKPRRAYMEFTAGGASAVVKTGYLAEAGIAVEEVTSQSFANAQTIDFGNPADFTVDVSSYGDDAVVGDRFEIDILPAAHEYAPESDEASMKTATIWVYYDGILHKLRGCRGTWTMEASGMEYARFSFTFTGDYVDPMDVASIPTGNYETTSPKPVELAQLILQVLNDDSIIDLDAQQFTMDIANQVVVRESINEVEAYKGAVIVSRKPMASFNPEAVKEATWPFWQQLKDGTNISFRAIVGSGDGNVVSFRASSAQIGNLGYGNRTELRNYNVELQLATPGAGDDELVVAFS